VEIIGWSPAAGRRARARPRRPRVACGRVLGPRQGLSSSTPPAPGPSPSCRYSNGTVVANGTVQQRYRVWRRAHNDRYAGPGPDEAAPAAATRIIGFSGCPIPRGELSASLYRDMENLNRGPGCLCLPVSDRPPARVGCRTNLNLNPARRRGRRRRGPGRRPSPLLALGLTGRLGPIQAFRVMHGPSRKSRVR
jgi:hypothetical protein